MRQTNKDRQTIGRKGAESRARLMDATTRLIGEMPVQKLTASAIARGAGLASQTFYLYFRNVEEALLHLAVTAQTDMQGIRSTLDQPWDLDAIALHADLFVDAFYRYWDRHRARLTVRNFLADSGNDAFVRQRSESAMPIINGIAQRILAGHGAGAVSGPCSTARGNTRTPLLSMRKVCTPSFCDTPRILTTWILPCHGRRFFTQGGKVRLGAGLFGANVPPNVWSTSGT